MKRYISIITLLAAVATCVVAQQLPNSGFEDWNGPKYKGEIQPTSWNYSNVTQFGFEFNFAHREAGRNGGYCAMAQDQAVGAAGIEETSPSYFSLGQPWTYVPSLTAIGDATAGTVSGISFAYRPDSMYVWIKRTGANVTKENFNIVFYSWRGTAQGSSYKGKNGGCTSYARTDEESDIRLATDANECTTTTPGAQVAEGWVKEMKAYPNWTQIKVPIYYRSNEKPQKCNVIFSASNYPNFRANSGLFEGNTLYVDDVELIYSSKIDELYINNKKWAGFNRELCNGEEQVYALGLGVTTIPDLFAKRGVGNITNCRGTSAQFGGRVLEGAEININKSGAAVGGEPVTITVKSEDGKKTSVYKIKFVAEQSSNNRLNGISYTVGGTTASVPNFSGYIDNYNVELPYGTTTAPTVSVTKGDEGQTLNITQPTSVTGTATIEVTAANGAKKTYSVKFSVGKLTDNTLTDIKIGGNSLPGFSPTKTSYTVELPLGTTKLPTITPISAYASGEQTISVINGVTISGDNCTGTYNIAVKAPGNATTRTYKLSFKITASSYKLLGNLKLDGTQVAGWNAETFTYYCNLPLGTTQLPTVTYDKGDAYQTVSVDASGISGTNGTYKIVVTAANGDQAIYKIVFATAQSSVSTLKAIKLDGMLLAGFDSNVFAYNVELPIGTNVLPSISVEKGDVYQNEPTIILGGVNGTTRIVVKAQDGTTSTYSIAFSVKQANSTALKSLQVEGYEIDFSADKLEYNVQLVRGTTALPSITYEPDDAFQRITQKDGGVNGDTKITVKAQTGATAVYVIHFSVEKSSDASLTNIAIGGVDVENFDSETLVYNIELPAGTTALPAISYEKGDYAQTIQLIKGDVNGTSQLVVTAEDGTQRTYTLNTTVQKSANAFLKSILVDGTEIAGFDPEQPNYTYKIDTNVVKKCPLIEVVKNVGQSVAIVKPTLLGTATIRVKPETGAGFTYTILITDRDLNANSHLANITIGGENLAGFSGNVTNYEIQLPNSATALPEIAWTKGHETQRVTLLANGINGTSQLIVVAENGTKTTYKLTFVRAKSADVTLKSIKVGGVLLDGFASNKLNYTYNLPADAITLPELTFEGNAAGQTFVVTKPALLGVAQIAVTSADGAAHTIYTVDFAKTKRSDATIDGIEIDGEAVADFAAGTSDYAVERASGSDVETIALDIDHSQYIAVADAGANGTQIAVAAEDGTTKIYNVAYNMQPSDFALLADLQLYDGNAFVSVDGFEANKFLYNKTLAWRTPVVPNINAVAGNAGQTITIRYNGVNDTTVIRVAAEDGTHASEYRIVFEVEKSNLTTLDNLMIDDAELLPDFDAETLVYTAKLPYGTRSVPTIRWDYGKVNNLAVNQQVISVVDRGLNDTAEVKVVAENGESRTYKIAFEVAEPEAENSLEMFIVEGVGNFTETNVDVELPYGTKVLPTITYLKKYEEQTVLIDNGGIYAPTTITVKANRVGVADKVYTLNPRVAAPQAALSGIVVNGTPVADFDPNKHQYIVPVDAVPSVEWTPADHASIDDEVVGTKQATISLVGKDDKSEATYTLIFYYTNDVVPNANFDNWVAANNTTSAQKPEGWNVLADFAAPTEVKSSATIIGFPIGQLISKGTYTPGGEVTKSGNFISLNTKNSKVIAGAVPGLITLGDMSATLNDGSSATSVFGGMSFRNTPDTLQVRYNAVSKSNVNNLRISFSLNNGQFKKEFASTTFNNAWRTATLILTDNTVQDPATMNITINSCENENISAINKKATSQMLLDWVRLGYNSRIARVLVNGEKTTGFSGKYNRGWVQAVKIDAETQGVPVLTFVGEVSDQEYSYTIGEELENCSGDYRTRVANITAKAEDGTLSHYVLNLNRPFSKNADLAGIIVDGDTLKSFAANTLIYNVEIANGKRINPDLNFTRGNEHQRLQVRRGAMCDTIVVTAENGTQKRYVLNYRERKSAETTLKNIAIEGQTLEFAAATETYNVTLPAEALLPVVTYTKQSDGQTVELTTDEQTTLKVVAENGVDSRIYRINFSWNLPVTSGQLTELALVGDRQLQGFARNRYDYSFESNAPVAAVVERADNCDSIVQTIAANQIQWAVKGTETHVYTLDISCRESNNADLATITLDGVALSNFDANVNEYNLDFDEAKPAVILAQKGENGQTISASIVKPQQPAAAAAMNAAMFNQNAEIYAIATFVVTAEDGVTQKTTTVNLRRLKSDNALLADIAIDGTTIADFAETTFDYEVELPCANPKIEEPTLPTLISFVAGHASQTIQVENNGLNATSYINVLAEDGTENVYSLDFVPQESANADLTSIVVNNVAIADFDPNQTEYVVELASNAEPEMAYTTADRFQRSVELEMTQSAATYTVTAENGDVKVYRVAFAPKAGSHKSMLAQIEVGNAPLEGFAPNKTEYSLLLPVGTEDVPNIVTVLGDAGQTVDIDYRNGLRDTTQIVVTAADGVSQTIYRIFFDVELSGDATLKMIYVDADSLQMATCRYAVDRDFAAETTTYNVTLPVGSYDWPNVAFDKATRWQEVETDTLTNERYNKSLALDVTAENGNQNRYVINFVVEKSAVDTLKNISLIIGGVEENLSLESEKYTLNQPFAGTVNDYSIVWEVGTRDVVEIDFEAGDEYQTIEVDRPESLDGTATITVTAENGTVRIYTIASTLLRSDVDTLKTILVDGLPFEGTELVLPYGSTELPTITWEMGDEYQTIVCDTVIDGLEGKLTLTVTAENGSVRTYEINISIEKSHNALLKTISVAGTPINGFVEDLAEYTVSLPFGTTEVPEITWELGEPNQHVAIVAAATLADTTILTVTAEDGIATMIYRIAFELSLADNALLDMIFVNGEAIDSLATKFVSDADFEPEHYEYNIELPYGTTEIPTITWKSQLPEFAYKSISLANDSTALPCTSTISVVSQDEMNMNDYTLHFTVALSDNNRLKDLRIEGVKNCPDFEPLFDPDSTMFVLTFANGTSLNQLPKLENVIYEKGDDDQTVEMKWATTMVDTTFTSGTVTLVAEGYLQHFVADSLVVDTLAIGSVVELAEGDTLTTKAEVEDHSVVLITVTAQNGSVRAYALYFEIEKSDDAFLQDIVIDGRSLREFEPTIFDYNYLFAKGATIPPVEGVLRDTLKQTLEYGEDPTNANVRYIYCTAEDGSSNTYTITFVESTDNPGDEPTAEDVCWSPLGNGTFKASTSRNGVNVAIFDTSGRLVTIEKVPLVDPNDDICDAGADGVRFHFDNTHKAYIYAFYYNKKIISQGKFIY